MTSIMLTFIVSLLSITNLRALQDSTTKSCNYALDIWWSSASPPSNSPTPEPTDQPTQSPTPEPTMVNQTLIFDTDTNDRGEDGKLASASGMNLIFFLNPYRINQCYNLNFTSEPFNEVAWKYTCKDSSTLKREIWWDSLECTGIAGETMEISENQRGSFTQFICDASKDCAYADITVVPAITMSPTPEPTEEPTTTRPTATPTNAVFGCALIEQFFGCNYYINNTNVTCQCDRGCDGRGDCCSDYWAVCEDTDVLEIRDDVSGGRDSSFVQCDNTEGPQPNAEAIYEWSYGTNICVSMLDFYGIFLEGDNITDYTGPVWHIGWQCVADSYYMALFNGSDCSKDPQKFIQYSDNSCAFDGGAWAHVSCSEEYQTPPPTPRPTIKPPTVAPTTTEGCRGECGDGEICVVTTGECESKIVNEACKNDNQCVAKYGAKYKCKTDQFCYLSECEEDRNCVGDAAGGYECEVTEVESPVEYEYGICKELDVGGGDGGGVERNGVMIAVAFIVGLSVFM